MAVNAPSLHTELLERLERHGFDPAHNRLLVGFSGGLDSTVLLHVAAAAVPGRVTAIHINHRQAPDADGWECHCQETAARLGVPLIVERLEQTEFARPASEATLRSGRYAAYRRHLAASDWLLLAHHADDQAETVLYRLLRGGGLDGLAGMPETRSVGSGRLLRPFLALPRQALVDEAVAAGWTWLDDPSNSDLRYARNFIRHRLLAPARTRWPDVSERLAELAATARDQVDLVRRETNRLRDRIDLRDEAVGVSLSFTALEGEGRSGRRCLLREIVHERFGGRPGPKALDRLEREVLGAEVDRVPQLKLGHCVARRFRNRLYLTPILPDAPTGACDWPTDTVLDLAPLCRIRVDEGAGRIAGEILKVSFRRGGERCHPLQREHSQTLKRLFQEYSVEPWLRDRMPLLWRDGRIVAVGDRIRCDEAVPQVHIDWLPTAVKPRVEGVG